MAIISVTEITNAPHTAGNKMFFEVINDISKYQSSYLNFTLQSALQWSVVSDCEMLWKKRQNAYFLSFQI
jgi:hypothetical protein